MMYHDIKDSMPKSNVVKSVARQISTITCAPVGKLDPTGSCPFKMATPPGPSGLPLIGQAFSIDKDRLHLQFMEWQKIYGDIFMFDMLGKHYLVVSHPDIIRKMFTTCPHAAIFNDRPAGFMGTHVIGKTRDIVFRNYDDQQRALKAASRDYVERTLKEEGWFYDTVQTEIEHVGKIIQMEKSKPLKIMEILDRSASRIIALMLSGRLLEDTDTGFASLLGFTASGNHLGAVKTQTLLTKMPCARKLPGDIKRTYNRVMLEKGNMRRHFVEENKSEVGLVAMLQKMKQSQADDNEAEQWLTDDFILGVVMDMSAAAIVPLQNTLSVLFLVLAHHPEVQEKIRQEVLSITSASGKLPSIHDFDRMHYTRACVLELNRFHSPLPISARHCNRIGEAVYDGYRIPKNTEIFSNLFGMHHDERFWEDPWSFKPERFLSEDGGSLLPEDHARRTNLVAQGVGPRACAGKEFADNVLTLYAASLVSKFSFQPADTEPLPVCDPRQFAPGVVTRAPNYVCKVEEITT